jgi:glycosyltransferase involved in cell wall biosynthesis
VGNLNHPPNREGLIAFNDSILPELVRRIPDVVVNIVGRSPVTDRGWAAIERLRSTGRYEFDLDVSSCTPHYVQAAASIVPIFFGGGTRLKILESFAHRCPVISTRKGCEGLDVAHGKHLLVGDSAEAFATACAELIRTPSLGKEMAETAYRYFESNHSQKVVDGLLVSAFRSFS